MMFVVGNYHRSLMAQFLRHRKKSSVMLVTNLALPMLCYAFYQRLTR
ncbi:hypothetical protein HUSEC41_09697 [Escherichia coli O104:H4 str. 01-09591]|nr:hypothetical protein HUSEC41_09697 [Escherichia coli O104:H4 str. 01-09591]